MLQDFENREDDLVNIEKSLSRNHLVAQCWVLIFIAIIEQNGGLMRIVYESKHTVCRINI